MDSSKAETSVEFRENAITEDNLREKDVPIWDSIKQHKKICWWTFFFCMSSVGW
jgi:hypothetical protein